MHAKSLQSCLTLCDPINCSPPSSSVLSRPSPGKNTRVGCHSLLPGDLPDPGIEPNSLMSPSLASGFFSTRCFQIGEMMKEDAPVLVVQVSKVTRDSASGRGSAGPHRVCESLKPSPLLLRGCHLVNPTHPLSHLPCTQPHLDNSA